MSFIANKYLVCSVPESLWRLVMIDVGSGAAASCYSLAGPHFHACKQLVVFSFEKFHSFENREGICCFETLFLKSVLCCVSVKNTPWFYDLIDVLLFYTYMVDIYLCICMYA